MVNKEYELQGILVNHDYLIPRESFTCSYPISLCKIDHIRAFPKEPLSVLKVARTRQKGMPRHAKCGADEWGHIMKRLSKRATKPAPDINMALKHVIRTLGRKKNGKSRLRF